jgi:hypothetical protein
MLDNSIVNRVLHKTLWAALLPAYLLWAVAAALDPWQAIPVARPL